MQSTWATCKSRITSCQYFIEICHDINLTVIESSVQANCKSIMGLMMLGASCGTSVKVTVSGQDEIEAAAAIKTLIQNRFGEEH